MRVRIVEVMKRRRSPQSTIKPKRASEQPYQARDGLTALPRAAWVALFAVAVVLVVCVDDRHVGAVADGRQMIRTAIAITETGEIGQARDTDFTLPRPGGDAVSRFGMGFSLLQVPAAWLAPKIEALRGPASSQFLFLLVPMIGVLLTAWAAAHSVLLLGAPPTAAAPAVLLASLASPLGSYAAMEFSEPVQAAALGLAFAAALASAGRRGPVAVRLAVVAGGAAGFAVLTKSSLVVAVPWTLLPLFAGGDVRRARPKIIAAAAGATPVLVVWLAFELNRFGHLFGGYPDDRFTNGFFDGLWRLTVGPNRGLIVFFPAAVLAAVWAWNAFSGSDRSRRLAASGAWLPTAAMLAVAAPYWGWHGMEGWGPRLIVPSIALLAPLAVAWLSRWPRRVVWTFVGIGVLLNLAPIIQHPTPVATYIMNCRWPAIPPDKVVKDFPFYARSETADGSPTVVPFEVLEREPRASEFLVYPWFFAATLATDTGLAERLAAPPWSGVRPDIIPEPALLRPPLIRKMAPHARLGFLGRSLWTTGSGDYVAVYDDGLRDQVVRAHQLRDTERSVELARKLVRLVPTGESDALMLESFRIAGWRTQAQDYLRSLPRSRRENPKINVVLALFERDAGNDASARALLAPVAEAFRGAPAEYALSQPLLAWPTDLHTMTTVPRRDAQVSGPARP
jgi:hypothetical protein